MQHTRRIDPEGYIKDAWAEMLTKAPAERVSKNNPELVADKRGWAYVYPKTRRGWLNFVDPSILELFPKVGTIFPEKKSGVGIVTRQQFPFVTNTRPEFSAQSTNRIAYVARPMLVAMRSELGQKEIGFGFEISKVIGHPSVEKRVQGSLTSSDRLGILAVSVWGHQADEESYAYLTTRIAGNNASLLNPRSPSAEETIVETDVETALLVIEGFQEAMGQLR